MRTTLVPIAVAMLLSACAHNTALIEPGREVAITASARAEPQDVEVSNPGAGKGALRGAGFGALDGALVGVACGPFVPLCVPVFMTAGAMVGVVVGGAAGAISSSSATTEDAVEARAREYVRDHDVQALLKSAIAAEASRRWSVVPQSDAQLTVQVDHALLRLANEKAVLDMGVTVAVRVPGTRADPPITKKYWYRSSPNDVRYWIDDRDGFVAESFRVAYAQIGRDVVMDLTK